MQPNLEDPVYLSLDLGGTKLHAGVVSVSGGEFRVIDEKKLLNDDFSNFFESVGRAHQLFGVRKFEGIGVCIGGPVHHDFGRLTNRDWVVSKDELSSLFKTQNVFLMNDMQAQGYGTLCIAPDQDMILQKGNADSNGNRVILAVGTGLGEGVISCVDGRYTAHAGEGGHATFASETDEDWAFYKFLREKYQHVSWERVVSGKDGFRNFLEFFGGNAQKYRDVCSSHDDVGKFVMESAESGDVVCQKIVRKMMCYLGREAGNLCLKALATGGVYLSGGVCHHLKNILREEFLTGFHQKGRFESILRNVPVHLSLDSHQALKGIAYALHHKFLMAGN